MHVLTTQDQYDNKLAEACATRLCSHTFNVGLIFEPREGRIVTSSMLTSMCMEVTYNCRLLGLSHLLVLADFAHM